MGFVTVEQKRKIVNHFGLKRYKGVADCLTMMVKRWEITTYQFIESYSVNIVFIASSNKYGEVVMKFCNDAYEFQTEVGVLIEADGRGYCKLYDYDSHHFVLVEEKIGNGIALSEEEDLNRRLEKFTKLFKEIYRGDRCNVGIRLNLDKDMLRYKSYLAWYHSMARTISEMDEWQPLIEFMQRGKAYFDQLWLKYNQKVLLHGDFHYYNIMKDFNGSYKIIDPKGVLGDPFFDVARYMLNEFWDEEDAKSVELVMDKVFKVISRNLAYPVYDLMMALFTEACLSIGWSVESGASIDKLDDYIETLSWLEKYVVRSLDDGFSN